MPLPFRSHALSFLVPTLALLGGAAPAVPLHAATSLSQFGITWTLDADYPSGTFANGDYWVVGPVTVVAISPADPQPDDGVDVDGTVINPRPETTPPYWQGWDSRIGDTLAYDRSRNLARQLPLRVPAGSSLVSVRSYTTGPNARKLWLADAAVLTVLDRAPPAGSFRPPYAGTDKSIPGNVADLNLGIFRSLPAVPGTPSLASFRNAFAEPLLDLIAQWPNSTLKTANAGPNYGRDIARQVGDAALSLNLDHPVADKTPLLIRLVQRGIDTYGLAKAGMVWFPNGGHNTGRKLPLLIAAKALGRADMLAWADGQQHPIFQEDAQHWYVSQEDVDLPREGSGLQPYTKAMIGMPEWASNPLTERAKTGAQWGKPYRIVNGVADTGLVLAAELMGLRKEWNWNPLFDYIDDRFWPAEGLTPSSSQRVPAFQRNMWVAYELLEPLDIAESDVATEVWQNLELPSQTGSFTVAFDTVASASRIDGFVGLSEGDAAGAGDMIAALRFAPSGRFEALNGDTYEAASQLDYAPGVTYRVVATVDLVAQEYSVTITPPDSAPVKIADRWQLRGDPLAVDSLNFMSSGGYHAVLNPFVFPD